jgi:signal peptidase
MKSLNFKNLNLKKIGSALWYAFLAFMFLVLVSIFISRAQGDVPRVFGYSIMKISSGSMEDTIPTGAHILIKKTAPEDIKKGDIICFYSEDPKIYGYPNTHRVIEDPIKTDSGYEYVTQGDFNPLKDEVTAKGNKLIGRYVIKLTFLTAITDFFTTKFMLVCMVTVQLACICLFMFTYSASKKQKAEKEAAKAEENKAPSEDEIRAMIDGLSEEELNSIMEKIKSESEENK